METMYCIHCGKEIPEDSLFCPECGKEISNKENDLTKAVKRYKESHQESDFSVIYNLSYSKMYGLIYSKARDKEITEDVLQNAYIQCFNYIDQLTSPDSFLGWLSTICTRELYHCIKKSTNEILIDDITDDEGNATDFFDLKADETFVLPEKAAEDKALQKQLMKTIEALPIKQRAAVISYYYNSQSVKDIAAEMGVPENTVKTYLSRARKSMAVSVDKYANVNGLKLVPIAAIPFLSLMFKNDAKACESLAGDGTVLKTNILHGIKEINSTGTVVAKEMAKEVVKGVASKTGATAAVSVKSVVVGSALAIAVAGAGIGAAVYNNMNSSDNNMDFSSLMESSQEDVLEVNAEIPSEEASVEASESLLAEITDEVEIKQKEEPIGKEVDLQAIWGDIDVQEYVDPELNVHFYLPTTVSVNMRPTTGWETTGYSVYLTGEGMQDEYFLTTGAETYEVSLNSDAASYYEIFQEVGNMQYMIYPPFEDSWPEPSEAALAFYYKYGQQIIASAWVPGDNPNPYYTLSVGSDDAPDTNEPYWAFHGVPSGIDIAQDGKKTFIVGDDIEAGNYTMNVTFGYGSLAIMSEQGEIILEKTGIDGAVGNYSNEYIDLNNGEIILLDADPGEALAITFSKK